jgi:serine phosphatase RsbU (regulator of sigma subunit)
VLGEGATLVLYSDGLVERRGESIDRGLERLAASAERFAALPLPAFCEALVDDLLGEREVRDDVVVVGVRLLVRTPLAGERGDQVASGST